MKINKVKRKDIRVHAVNCQKCQLHKHVKDRFTLKFACIGYVIYSSAQISNSTILKHVNFQRLTNANRESTEG